MMPSSENQRSIPSMEGQEADKMDWESFFVNLRKPGFVPGFEIINKLGSGVFGEVYKARKESIGRFYAIKFLKVADDNVSEAVFKELDSLQHLAQLDHPNLVTIEDRGEVSGIPFIIMGYAGDDTLKLRLSQGDLSHESTLQIFEQVCAGVSALHRSSIVHFDLKPANIFLNGHHARVGDYGLSKIMNDSHKTMSMGRGTPYYMAPEMLNRTGDHKSDIYSLGVILFEMATGQVPFEGDSEWEVLQKHEREPVKVPRGVDPTVRRVILRAMSKNPDMRFPSIDAMLHDLTGSGTPPVASGEGGSNTSSPPPLPGKRPPHRLRRDVERNLSAIGQLLEEEGGERAESARRDWKERASASEEVKQDEAGLDGGSFYSDFEQKPEPAKQRDLRVVKKQRSAFSRFFCALFAPIRWLVQGIAAVFRGVFSILKEGFSNLLRYAIVAVITAVLVVTVVFLINGQLW